MAQPLNWTLLQNKLVGLQFLTEWLWPFGHIRLSYSFHTCEGGLITYNTHTHTHTNRHTHTHTHTHRANQRNFPNIPVLFRSNTGPLHPFQDQPPNPCLDPISYRPLKNHNTSGVYTLSLQYLILFLFIGSFLITLNCLGLHNVNNNPLNSCTTKHWLLLLKPWNYRNVLHQASGLHFRTITWTLYEWFIWWAQYQGNTK